MVSLRIYFWAIFLLALATISLWDLRIRRIPNWLTLTMVGAGLGARAIDGGFYGALGGMGGTACGLALLFYPFSKHWVGAGDVKLLAAIGVWLGPFLVAQAMLAACLVGGVLSFFFIAKASRVKRKDIWTNLRLSLYTRSIPDLPPRAKKESPPYALALSAGALAVWLFHAI